MVESFRTDPFEQSHTGTINNNAYIDIDIGIGIGIGIDKTANRGSCCDRCHAPETGQPFDLQKKAILLSPVVKDSLVHPLQPRTHPLSKAERNTTQYEINALINGVEISHWLRVP